MKYRLLPALGLAVMTLGVLGFAAFFAFDQPPVNSQRYLVGAYYYLWYPQNFKQGYLREKLVPPQEPVLGRYDSGDPKVAERHISWCSQYGIDFLALDIWPRRKDIWENIDKGFLKAKNINDIKFCIFLETQDLPLRRCDGGSIFYDKKEFNGLVKNLGMAAGKYFNHPSYLKIRGRPVIMLYLTRLWGGYFREAMQAVREDMAKRGWNPFIIGDEIFYKVASTDNSPLMGSEGPDSKSCPKHGIAPQPERIRLFDAITPYNLYEGGDKAQKGYISASRHVPHVSTVYRRYQKVAGPVMIVPHVFPGYNDRGTRVNAMHYVIPRQAEPGGPEGGYFRQAFDKLALAHKDDRLNMIMITSFNEWNEDTNIEPVKPAPPTKKDSSKSGELYTGGFAFEGYGTKHLEVIRDKAVGISGRVLDSSGNPMAGVLVWAKKWGWLCASAFSDSRGYFTLSRLHISPGEYRVVLPGRGISRQAVVKPGYCTTGINFTINVPR
jgi:glycoprotein endo-alpha-1,2-mannosidase